MIDVPYICISIGKKANHLDKVVLLEYIVLERISCQIIGKRFTLLFSRNSFNELPDIYEMYPGIKGNTHGDKKLIRPAPNATVNSIINF